MHIKDASFPVSCCAGYSTSGQLLRGNYIGQHRGGKAACLRGTVLGDRQNKQTMGARPSPPATRSATAPAWWGHRGGACTPTPGTPGRWSAALPARRPRRGQWAVGAPFPFCVSWSAVCYSPFSERAASHLQIGDSRAYTLVVIQNIPDPVTPVKDLHL